MTISILSNQSSLQAQRNLGTAQASLADSIGRLSSGMRINRAADDAAGLGISENLKADIRSLAQAQRNTNDGISLTQVAEGGMNEMQGIVTRMRELAIQSANGTLGTTERGYIQTEFTELSAEVNRISAVTEYNGQKLLDGTASGVLALKMQVGIQNSIAGNDQIKVDLTKLTTSTLGSTSLHVASAKLDTATNARAALAVFDKAIEQLSGARAKVGAVQNRMQVTVSNLAVAHENLSAANSRIRDVDVASETATLTRAQILSQAGVAVLAQANQIPSAALSLLR